MQDINDTVEHFEKKAFNSKELLNLIDNKANLVTYPQLAKYNSLDEAMGKHKALIILYLTSHDFGHWVCIFKHHNTVEFFDPYGLKPDEELKWLDENIRDDLKQRKPHLSYLLDKSKYDIEYNHHKFQKMKDGINTCGRHVAMRLILRDIPLERYIKLMKGDSKYSSDWIITMLTLFID